MRQLLVIAIFFCGQQPTSPLDTPAPDEKTAGASPVAVQSPEVSLAEGVEEGKKVLVASVKLEGKPLEGVKVAFYVERSFGKLLLGEEETLDDGSAAVPFPDGLPGGPTGQLSVLAETTAPPEQAGARTQAMFAGGKVVAIESDPYPRGLWAPRAPIAFIVTFAVLVGGVWIAYGYVTVQLFRIRSEGGEP